MNPIALGFAAIAAGFTVAFLSIWLMLLMDSKRRLEIAQLRDENARLKAALRAKPQTAVIAKEKRKPIDVWPVPEHGGDGERWKIEQEASNIVDSAFWRNE